MTPERLNKKRRTKKLKRRRRVQLKINRDPHAELGVDDTGKPTRRLKQFLRSNGLEPTNRQRHAQAAAQRAAEEARAEELMNQFLQAQEAPGE
jgi:glycyl-tRNA synthetase beta subunit